ncbi:SMP-30/gluconolactonase/LRE family protein [Salinarimonas ramus]|uniref:Gluconolactonase n=1 Tax=Salinarimonas ramus TaxID=690164 RepID=A0A917V4B3_9HYPH|nr:SMP-30/gluconolactonase/LRE family protein [Salinarimonas ramus]GGK34979.1 gluconolactonase [Salinarimonas ramus]
MSLYPPPKTIEARIFSRMPDDLRVPDTSPPWAAANKPGRKVDCFLEGPSFDREGNLWLVDIPYGRILKVSPAGEWSVACRYEGWPNGLKIDADGRVYIADYMHGILVLEPGADAPRPLVTHRHSEHFRGCNDLFLARDGSIFFTDQGQSGMHMQNGRVYRYDPGTSRLDLLIDTGQSPNGLVMDLHEEVLYVAMTRGNSVWRLPIMADGAVSKVGVFVQISGGLSGPDGMALDETGGLWVAHAGNGCVWGFDRLGHPKWRVVSPTGGLTTTNIAFGGPGNRDLYITESDTGHVLVATLPVAGKPMRSHL